MLHQPSPRPVSPAAVVPCAIALGSNIGDRRAHLTAAALALGYLTDFSHPLRRAPIYETDPLGCPPGTAPFYNTVVTLGWFGSPADLLAKLRLIETALGRPATRAKNSPRTVDLDLLYCGDAVLDTPELTLPHPRLAERAFVLRPLADLAPAFLLPRWLRTPAELLAALPPAPAPPRLVTVTW